MAATIHSGGQLSDALLVNMRPSNVRSVYASKVSGLLGLWADASLQPTAHNVAFSSVAALLGSAGQSNYAAANAVEDACSSAIQVSPLIRLSNLQSSEASQEGHRPAGLHSSCRAVLS